MTNEDGRMSGPEHYREAERLLLSCQLIGADDHDAATYPAIEDGVDSDSNGLRAAQVHATLALAAASAMETVSQFMGLVRPDSMGDDQVITEWAKATGWSTIAGASQFPSEDSPF
jgi:hypothetical protein